ncbi:mannonate dehydratase [Sporolactobacillus sp. THM7-4]|nr:mannonate dehydratase [Sporolactobacillus sp. THM7-4]
MQMSFRWFGKEDPVPLSYIRQIPNVKYIVSAIYDIPVGEVWPVDRIMALKKTIEQAGFKLNVIESVPIHEDIKLGLPTRDKYIDNYKQTIHNLGKAGIPRICYNFMPIFDWTRSSVDYKLEDGSTALMYDDEKIRQIDPLKGDFSLPGWDTSYKKEELADLFNQYHQIDKENLWENLEYFIREIIPVAEEENIKMAIHPDDPPWDIFGLPRIITNLDNLKRFLSLYDSPNNGICMCSGSLAEDKNNNFPEMLREILKEGKVNFVHLRNIKLMDGRSFKESGHLSENGSIDFYQVMKILSDFNYEGPVRPDHGRMIWGEQGRPGYGLYDRALGAAYLNGLWEAVRKEQKERTFS